jgi:dolichol-phosphate mannosyltransferase
MRVSVIAPMYNEEENVEKTFFEIKKELDAQHVNDYEIIFVNDGSTDNTLIKVNDLAEKNRGLKVVSYKQNKGRGHALRTGFSNATGDIILTIDFDLTYDVSHITRMIRELENSEQTDVVLVSAYMPGGKVIGVTGMKLFFSKWGNFILRQAFSKKIYTSTCVVRGYRKAVLDSLMLESNGKEIHLEILSKVLANGFEVKEIPGFLHKRKFGKSKTKFTATSISHLIYFIHEKPFLIFGFIGTLLVVLGFLSSFVLFYTRFSGNLAFNESLLSKIASPNFVTMLFFSGMQMVAIGFLGIQNNILKKEMMKIQRMINKGK